MLELNSSVPLYEQLMNAIRADIDQGIFKAGEKLPTEAELEEKYAVSRITVRRAIKELCDDDILIKKQGKGTFAQQNVSVIALAGNVGFHDFFESRGVKVRSELKEKRIIKAKKSIVEDRGIEADDDVLFLKRVLYANDVAKMIDLNYLPMKLYPGIYERIGQEFSLFRILKEAYGVESYQQYKVLKVCVADDDKAKALSVKEGSALFDMYKVSYMASGAPIHVSISYISGESASYVISGEESRQFYSGFNWKT